LKRKSRAEKTKSGGRPDPVEFFAFESLACSVKIKRKPAQQNLIGLSERLHPGTSIDLQAVEILGFAGVLMFFDPDFSDMDPDPVEHQPTNRSREHFTASEGFVKTMKKKSPAVSISSPSLNWPKISRITAW
jgi:hypothetical protein